MRRSSLAIVLLCIVACALALPACKKKRRAGASEDDSGKPAPAETCEPDGSFSFAAFEVAALDTPNTGFFCPRRDVDYWQVPVSEANTLVSVELLYEKLSNVRLAVDWYGPQGVCVSSSVSCTASGQCAAGEVCDVERGACRSAEGRSCLEPGDCAEGQQCAVVRTRIAQEMEPVDSGSVHRLATHLPARRADSYFLVVYDQAEVEEDGDTSYRLVVGQQSEPDTAEPNDAPHLATEMSSGGEVQGVLSFTEDEDWYLITPGFSSAAVVNVEVRWPAGQSAAPTWTVVQGDWTFPSVRARTEGNERVRRDAVVAPDNGPVYLRVQRNQGAAGDDQLYTVRFSVEEDPDEKPGRNDTPSTATLFAAGAASAGQSFSDSASTLVASNDADWYRIEPAASDESSLLYFKAHAAASAPFLLRAVFYKPTGHDCSSADGCAGSALCDTNARRCIAPWVFRPDLEGPDPQVGGLSPNHLETQLPIFAGAPLYVLVEHNPAAMINALGYDDSESYSLQMRHKEEPHLWDRQGRAEDFVPNPLGRDADDFIDRRRPEPLGATCQGCSGSTGNGFVDLVPGSVAVVDPAATEPACVPITLHVYDARGQTAGTGHDVALQLVPAVGAFVEDCNADPRLVLTDLHITAEATLGVELPAGTPAQTLTVRTSGAGLETADSLLTVATAPVPALLLQTDGGRDALVDAPSRQISVDASAWQGQTVTVRVEPAGSTELLVESLGQEEFTACGNPCTFTATSRVFVRGSGVGMRTVHATASGAGSASLHLQVREPWVLTQTPAATLSAEGYISYDGDQDWFWLDASGFPAGMVRVEVDYPAGQPDLRLLVMRGSEATGRGMEHSDECGDCEGGTCNDVRRTCDSPAISGDWIDPWQDSQGRNCAYLPSTADTIYVWVNDVKFNDWNDTQPYRFRLEIYEGCFDTCVPSYCQ